MGDDADSRYRFQCTREKNCTAVRQAHSTGAAALILISTARNHYYVWRSGQGVGLAKPRVAGSTPGLALSGNNLGQVVHTHTHVRLSSSSIIWYRSRGDRPPDRTWRRPPARPRNKWLDQLRNDSIRPIGELWRRAVDRGHGGATTRRP